MNRIYIKNIGLDRSGTHSRDALFISTTRFVKKLVLHANQLLCIAVIAQFAVSAGRTVNSATDTQGILDQPGHNVNKLRNLAVGAVANIRGVFHHTWLVFCDIRPPIKRLVEGSFIGEINDYAHTNVVKTNGSIEIVTTL